MKIAKVYISPELFLEVFKFPEGTDIKDIRTDFTVLNTPKIIVTLTHEDLHDLQEGEEIPMASPSWTRQEEIVFNGWGQ